MPSLSPSWSEGSQDVFDMENMIGSLQVIGRPQMSGGAGVAAGSSGSSSPNNTHDTNEKDALIYQDGQLVSGSFEALVQHLVPTSAYYPDRTYIFAFLLSSRLFVKPHALFQQVCQVCTFQQNLYTENVTKESLGKFGPHCIQLLSEWTEMFPYDFRDERMMKQLKDLTQRIVKIYPEMRKDVGIIMHNLLAKLAGLHKYEELLTRINQEVAHRLLNIMPTTDIYEVCSSPAVLAQQLTHIEMERLSMIGSEEFVQAFAKENEIEVSRW